MAEVTAVQGFGFLPSSLVSKAEDIFKVVSEGADTSNMSTEDLDELKCETVYIPSWRQLYPEIAESSIEAICPPTWDGASCLPPTPAGRTAVLPCMASAFGQNYSSDFNASRSCLEGGVWSNMTDYLDCYCKASTQPPNDDRCIGFGKEPDELSTIISLLGYTLSFLSLLLAMVIYLSLGEMRCLRHKVHMGLFCTFGLSALNWILTLSCVDLVHPTLTNPLHCTFFTLTYIFHLTSFHWMFLEGFYLFLQVQYPLSLVSIKYKHFLLFGLGVPILNTLLWFALRLHYATDANKQQCVFTQDMQVDFWTIQVPMLVILFWNTFFLVWIIMIVFSKLKEQTALDHDRRHLKAAKALVLVMPMLGFGHILNLVVKPTMMSMNVPMAVVVFHAVEAVIMSTQGFVISLLFCFFNGEVVGVVTTHWRRWRMVRTVGRSCSRPSASPTVIIMHGAEKEMVTSMTTHLKEEGQFGPKKVKW